MADIIEGRHAVHEALVSGMPAVRVLLADGARPGEAVDEILSAARAAGVPVAHVSRSVLDKMSVRGAHQGAMAEVRPFAFVPLEEVIAAAANEPSALIIALDHVLDPQNLGAVVRSAEVVGARAVLVPKKRTAAIGPAAFKASAGAIAHTPIVREPNLVRALVRLQEAGWWIAGASEAAPDTVWDAPMEGRIVLVMGSEESGLARLTAETCDFLVRLPVAGRVGSLNVAQAATALAFEWVRRGRTGR
ncbi:MAG: 23S rRNA (guanosine(2251)-2'-O)-methyltransferase RlmB [Actinomycetota bacterium]|nr:23S rRNA (guanosine(2251)-2'-O)-methyltransferase RlmB [Actinomycetota bacterium]